MTRPRASPGPRQPHSPPSARCRRPGDNGLGLGASPPSPTSVSDFPVPQNASPPEDHGYVAISRSFSDRREARTTGEASSTRQRRSSPISGSHTQSLVHRLALRAHAEVRGSEANGAILSPSLGHDRTTAAMVGHVLGARKGLVGRSTEASLHADLRGRGTAQRRARGEEASISSFISWAR